MCFLSHLRDGGSDKASDIIQMGIKCEKVF